jgi:hypothetical protein
MVREGPHSGSLRITTPTMRAAVSCGARSLNIERRSRTATLADVDDAARELAIRFDGRMVGYGFGELDTLVPA